MVAQRDQYAVAGIVAVGVVDVLEVVGVDQRDLHHAPLVDLFRQFAARGAAVGQAGQFVVGRLEFKFFQ